MADDTEQNRRDQRPQVAFDYIKGQLFRVVHADGVVGGITPNGGIHMAFFSERPAIPQREVRPINPDGSLGEVIPDKTATRNAMIREMDVDVMMSLPVAQILISWLEDRVSEIKMRATTDEAEGEKNA